MSRNKLGVIICAIAIAGFVYLGYRFSGNRNPVIMEKPAHQALKEPSLQKYNGGTKKRIGMETSVSPDKLNKNPEPVNIPRADSLRVKPTELKNEIKPSKGSLAKQPFVRENNPGSTYQDIEKLNYDTDTIDSSELNRLLSQVRQHEPDALRAVMNIASWTTDKRTLHGSLQALGRLGTNETNQVLSDAIGNNLDNSIEVTRILSYFNRSVPLDNSILNQLIKYADSSISPVETKKVILKKVIRIGGAYERDQALDLLRTINGS